MSVWVTVALVTYLILSAVDCHVWNLLYLSTEESSELWCGALSVVKYHQYVEDTRTSLIFRVNKSNLKLKQWPTWYTLALFYNTSIAILYVFRALHAHHQEVELYWCNIWYFPLIQWPSSAQFERELSQPVHRTTADWEDDTRCCINTIQPPDDEHIMLETCRGL